MRKIPMAIRKALCLLKFDKEHTLVHNLEFRGALITSRDHTKTAQLKAALLTMLRQLSALSCITQKR